MKTVVTRMFYWLACFGLGWLFFCGVTPVLALVANGVNGTGGGLGANNSATGWCDFSGDDDCSDDTPVGRFSNYALVNRGSKGTETDIAAGLAKLAGQPYRARLPLLADTEISATNGVNPFSVTAGNAKREIEDLPAVGPAGTVGLPWGRWNNTIPTVGRRYFGEGGDWRHSWQYELRGGMRDLALTYPSGSRRVFNKTEAGDWAAPQRFTEQIVAKGAGRYEVTTSDQKKLTFARTDPNGPEVNAMFRLQTLTDALGQAITFEYNKDGLLTKIAGPGGAYLALTYQNYATEKAQCWQKLAQLKTAPAADQWLEITVPSNLQSLTCRRVRLSSAYGSALAVEKVELYAPGSSTPLQGSAEGSGKSPESVFDSSKNVAYESAFKTHNSCTLSLDQLTRVARIRILPAPGKEGLLKGSLIEALSTSNNDAQPVLARVTSSNGCSVEYAYKKISHRAPLVLSEARYGDKTKAVYSYNYLDGKHRPLLAEADDPRYKGRAKQVRYTYQDPALYPFGMVHQEIAPATGVVYSSLELDPKDPAVRIVRFSDQRSETYRIAPGINGRVLEHVDALGRHTVNEYSNDGRGLLLAKTDPTGCHTTITPDQRGRIIETHGSDGSWQKFERDANGNIVKFTDSYGRVVLSDYDSDGHLVAVNDNQAEAGPLSGQVVNRDERADAGLVVCHDPAARIVRNDSGLITKITHPDGLVQQFTYDKYGHKVAETDGHGHTLYLSYDSLGRVVREQDFSGGVTKFSYAQTPKACSSCTVGTLPSRIEYPDGRVDEMLYDPAGRLLARTVAAGAPDAATTLYAYDERDRLIAQTDPSGQVTHYTYDQEGRRTP